MAAVAGAFSRGRPVATGEALAAAVGLPQDTVEAVLKALVADGVLAETGDQPPRFLPARPLEKTSLLRVLHVVRAMDAGGTDAGIVEALGRAVDRAVDQALADRTLKDLIEPGDAPREQPLPMPGDSRSVGPS
jgi:DNA-binding IscR family transcriptional regulator